MIEDKALYNEPLDISSFADIINGADLKQLVEVMKRKEILDNHNKTITEIKNGRYAGYYQTYVHTENGRKNIRAKSLTELADKLMTYSQSLIDKNKHTIEECYNGWIEYIKINKKQSTLHSYEKVFKRHFTEIKDKYIEDFSGYEIKVFAKKEVAEKKLTSKGYAALKTDLLGIYHYAKDKAYIDMRIEDVVSDLSRQLRGSFQRSKKSCKKDEDFIFSDEEIKSITDYCLQSDSLVDLGIFLLFGTGLRVGELAALKKTDIESDCQAINISRTEERIGSGANYVISDMPKTITGFRKVLLTENIVDVLKRIKSKSNSASEFLFANEILERFPAKKFRDRLYRLCIILDIPKRSPHAIRRTYASKLYEAGVPENLIIKQMGHIDFEVTKGFYIYNRKSMDEMIHELEKAF